MSDLEEVTTSPFDTTTYADGGLSAMPYEDAGNQRLLDQQATRESNARTYPRHLPFALAEAHGVTIRDMDGNTYYDCLAGAGTLALGHNHPVVNNAMEHILETDGPIHTLDITTPTKESFVDSLFESLPDNFAANAKIQFCGPAGTDAIEAALKLVKTATGNDDVLAFRGGYHGMTNGALSMMGDTHAKEELSGLMPGVHHLPFPYRYRSPFGAAGDADGSVASAYVERLLDDPGRGFRDPAGLFVELVQGEGGAVPAPDAWTQEIRRITRERDIPMVVDEIQTGLGRTGETFAFEHAGITPDVVTLSKAFGGGLPLAVVVYDESLDVWEPGAHAGTFRGNQLAMAAGEATIDYIRENDLDAHTAKMGKRLRGHLDPLAEQYDVVGDVRGRGLMLGVEFVDAEADPDSAGARPADDDLADRVRTECFERGLVIELGGRGGSTARFLPPLIVTPNQIDDIGKIFTAAVEAAIAA